MSVFRGTTERRAEPGEFCTCGRPATVVYVTERWGEVGACGASDGGRGGPKPCLWCGDPEAHGGERCPDYTLGLVSDENDRERNET